MVVTLLGSVDEAKIGSGILNHLDHGRTDGHIGPSLSNLLDHLGHRFGHDELLAVDEHHDRVRVRFDSLHQLIEIEVPTLLLI